MTTRHTPAPARRRAALSGAVVAFYSEFVESFPAGFAVLHLFDSHDPAGWRLVARNRVATRAVGSHVADFMCSPTDGFAPAPSNAPALYRDVIVHKRPKRIGFIRKPGFAAPQESYALTAIPLPHRCVGLLFEDATPALKAIRGRMEAESRLMQICESARAIFWTANPTTFEFRYVCPEAPVVLGYWVERWQHEGDFLRRHVHPDDWPSVQSTLARVAADAAPRHLDFRMFHVDGRPIWFRMHVRLVNGSLDRSELHGVMTDINDQKRGELGAREFSLQVLRGQESERKRISIELHENIAQCLGTVQWMLSALARGDTAEEDRAGQFQECSRLMQACTDQIRAVSYDLQPPVLEMLGLIPALQWHARRFQERTGIGVRLETPARGVERLGEDTEIALFRVFEECLANIQRHARTGAALARVRFESDWIVLEVEDCGVGVPPDLFGYLDPGGFGAGLLKLRETIRHLKGEIEVESNGRGTLVRATLPRAVKPSPSRALPRAGTISFVRTRKGVRSGAVARPLTKD